MQLEELLERECNMQIQRIYQEAERMQTRYSTALPSATSLALPLFLRVKPCQRSVLIFWARPLYRLRETATEAREILLAKPTRENEAKLDTLLRESMNGRA